MRIILSQGGKRILAIVLFSVYNETRHSLGYVKSGFLPPVVIPVDSEPSFPVPEPQLPV